MVMLSWAGAAVCVCVRWFRFLDVAAESGCVALYSCVCVCACVHVCAHARWVCLGLWMYWNGSRCAHIGYVCWCVYR